MNVDFQLRFCKQRKNLNNLLNEKVPVKWRLLSVPAKASITISIVRIRLKMQQSHRIPILGAPNTLSVNSSYKNRFFLV